MGHLIELIGACGLYCGACVHFRASFPEGKHLLEKAIQNGWEKEGYICKGCRSGVHYTHRGCSQCTIRKCTDEIDIAHCGLCPNFPCGILKRFQYDGHAHHLDIMLNLNELKRKGEVAWLKEQGKRWTCRCGEPFSWYEEECRVCGTILDAYGPFPKKNKK